MIGPIGTGGRNDPSAWENDLGADIVTTAPPETLHEGFRPVRLHRFRHRRFDGSWSGEVAREIVHLGLVVVVVPYDPVRDAVVFVQQLRIAAHLAGRAEPRLIECVAGLVDEGETVEEAARRETIEETGLTPDRMRFVRRWLATPGVADEDIHLFVARVSATEGGSLHGIAEEGEDIRRLVVPAADAIAMLDGPDLDNGHSLVAISAFARLHETLRRDWG